MNETIFIRPHFGFFTKEKDLSIGRECNALQHLLLAKK